VLGEMVWYRVFITPDGLHTLAFVPVNVVLGVEQILNMRSWQVNCNPAFVRAMYNTVRVYSLLNQPCFDLLEGVIGRFEDFVNLISRQIFPVFLRGRVGDFHQSFIARVQVRLCQPYTERDDHIRMQPVPLFPSTGCCSTFLVENVGAASARWSARSGSHESRKRKIAEHSGSPFLGTALEQGRGSASWARRRGW